MSQEDDDLDARHVRYMVWLQGLLGRVRGAIEARRDTAGWAELHIKLLDRIELVLTAKPGTKDGDGHHVSDPIARSHAKCMLMDLAEAYGADHDRGAP